MDLISLECPQCGASLPARKLDATTTCDYCGSRFQARESPVAKTQMGVTIDKKALEAALRHAAPRAAIATGSSLGCSLLSTLFAIFIGLTITAITIFTSVDFSAPVSSSRQSSQASDRQTKKKSKSKKVPGFAFLPVRNKQPALINIKGKDAVLARTRYVQESDSVRLEAFDIKKGTRLWRHELGNYSDAVNTSFFVVLAKKVVVTDGSGRVSLLNLKTGKRIKKRKLSDKAKSVCAVPGDPRNVWIEVADKNHQRIDITTGQMAPDKLPSACGTRRALPGRRRAGPGPEVEGFETKKRLVDGDIGILSMVKDPGTPIPKIAGFDPTTMAIRWKKAVSSSIKNPQRIPFDPQLDVLVAGRYFTVKSHKPKKEKVFELFAFDGRSGKRLWGKTLEPLSTIPRVEMIFADEKHLFVVRNGTMEVYDASRGKLMRSLGGH